MTVAYFDTSALVKLVLPEPETEALLGWSRSTVTGPVVTSTLSAVELVRAVRRHAPGSVPAAVAVLDRLDRIVMSPEVLAAAADTAPAELRTLDAIHLATARLLGSALTAFVVYDHRLRDAAVAAGLPVVTPHP